MALIAGFFGSACATLVTGTEDRVLIATSPPGATIEIQGHVAVAPATLVLSRSIFAPPRGTVTLHGYQRTSFEVPRVFNLWTIGNVATLFLGLPIDILSGAFLKHPARHEVLLQPSE